MMPRGSGPGHLRRWLLQSKHDPNSGGRLVAVRSYPYSFHVALDGSGLNGLEGRAGVCVFRYDPADNSYAYKVTYFKGIAGGHAVSVSPQRTAGFLGNTGQHLLFYDPRSLEESDRVSTMR